MKALLFDRGRLRITDLPEPAPPPGESLVRIIQAGVCATDIEIARGYMDFAGVPGHEFVGIVEESGRPELLGRRVAGEINCPCLRCEVCARGNPNHCPNRTVLGISGRNGCFAEFIALPDANLHPLPDSMTDFQGVMVEPTAAAFRVLEQLGDLSAAEVAVVGDGKLGLLVAQALASEGASVTIVGRHPDRISVLEKSPFEYSYLESRKLDLPRIERSFPTVVDCTGSPEGPAFALRLTAPLGTLVMKTTVREPVPLPTDRMVVDEIKVLGSRCGPFPRAIRALADGKVVVERMLTETFPLARADEALRRAQSPGVLKVAIAMQ